MSCELPLLENRREWSFHFECRNYENMGHLLNVNGIRKLSSKGSLLKCHFGWSKTDLESACPFWIPHLCGKLKQHPLCQRWGSNLSTPGAVSSFADKALLMHWVCRDFPRVTSSCAEIGGRYRHGCFSGTLCRSFIFVVEQDVRLFLTSLEMLALSTSELTELRYNVSRSAVLFRVKWSNEAKSNSHCLCRRQCHGKKRLPWTPLCFCQNHFPPSVACTDDTSEDVLWSRVKPGLRGITNVLGPWNSQASAPAF